jgi:serine/threonine protein kinase
VKAPNLCIVTEFVKLGSLRELLHNTSGVKLEWLRRMRMLRSAALGINYLHSLRPVIVHRDLKSSNLLVRHTSLKQRTTHNTQHPQHATHR